MLIIFFFSQHFLPQPVLGAQLIGPSFTTLRGRKARIKANITPCFTSSSSPCWRPGLWLSSKLMSSVPAEPWTFALPTKGKFIVSVPGGVLSLLGLSTTPPPPFLRLYRDNWVVARGCYIGSEVQVPFYRCWSRLWLEKRACCCTRPYLVATEHPLFPQNAWSVCWSQLWGG